MPTNLSQVDRRLKILFVHNAKTSFVQTDLEILQSAHNVFELPYARTLQYFATLLREIKECDLIFGWWASAHLLLPVLLAKRYGKKVIIAGGDYDVIYEINHGLLRDKGRYLLGHLLFRLMDAYVVQSDFSLAKTLAHRHIRPSKIRVIPHGFQDIADAWPRIKHPLVLTVGTVAKPELSRKGLETFVRTALMMPDVDFVLIGRWEDEAIYQLRSINESNITYLGFVSVNVLHQTMSESKVYVQVSLHEGFGCALAEAMLFECIPVVTRRGAIPEVVDDCGIYVPYGDVNATARAIRMALTMDGLLGSRARQQIRRSFPFEKRRNMLLQLVEKISKT